MIGDSAIRVPSKSGLLLRTVALWACIVCAVSPATAEQYDIKLSERLHAQGFDDSAQVVLDSILASDSVDAGAWMLQSRIHSAKEEWAARLDALRRVQSIAPKYPNLILDLTEAFLEEQMIDSAAACLEKLPLRQRLLGSYPSFLQAWILESQGRYDSSIAVYRRVSRMEEARNLVTLPAGVGSRLGAITLRNYDYQPEQLFPGSPSIFLFWKAGVGASEIALNDIAVESPKAGIEWRFVPIHVGPVDTVSADPMQRARGHAYKGTVWLDPDLRLFHHLGLSHVPTIIFAGTDSEIDQILQDWSASVRAEVFEKRFGNYTDTVSTSKETPDQTTLRADRVLAHAQATWSAGRTRDAVRTLSESLLEYPAHLLSHVQLADWRWRLGDTLGARVAAHQALALDSLNPWTLLVAAQIARRHKNHARAIELLKRCVTIDTEFSRGWAPLGIEATLTGDNDLAREALEHLRKLDPYDRRLPILMASLVDGDSKEQAASWHRAIRLLLR